MSYYELERDMKHVVLQFLLRKVRYARSMPIRLEDLENYTTAEPLNGLPRRLVKKKWCFLHRSTADSSRRT